MRARRLPWRRGIVLVSMRTNDTRHLVSVAPIASGTEGASQPQGRGGYRLVFTWFDGTLGELAHALRSERLAPEEIDLLALVRDFLTYFDRYAERDLDLASEALPAVAQVIELKVRLLLPRPPRAVDAEDEDDDLGEAISAVETLERLEGAIAFLRERRERRRFLVPARTRAPHFERRARPLDLVVGQLAVVAARYRLGSYFEIARDRLSVPEAMRRLLARLREARHSNLRALVSTSDWNTRTVYFVALLELVKERRLLARQEAPFADIELEHVDHATGGNPTAGSTVEVGTTN
ncbi:ScpA family protein [soil metagenome]